MFISCTVPSKLPFLTSCASFFVFFPFVLICCIRLSCDYQFDCPTWPTLAILLNLIFPPWYDYDHNRRNLSNHYHHSSWPVLLIGHDIELFINNFLFFSFFFFLADSWMFLLVCLSFFSLFLFFHFFFFFLAMPIIFCLFTWQRTIVNFSKNFPRTIYLLSTTF